MCCARAWRSTPSGSRPPGHLSGERHPRRPGDLLEFPRIFEVLGKFISDHGNAGLTSTPTPAVERVWALLVRDHRHGDVALGVVELHKIERPDRLRVEGQLGLLSVIERGLLPNVPARNADEFADRRHLVVAAENSVETPDAVRLKESYTNVCRFRTSARRLI